MAGFQYEWWNIDVKETTGVITWEIKAKTKDGAIRQIKKMVAEKNDETKPIWMTGGRVVEVLWDTLTLDHAGYQRRF